MGAVNAIYVLQPAVSLGAQLTSGGGLVGALLLLATCSQSAFSVVLLALLVIGHLARADISNRISLQRGECRQSVLYPPLLLLQQRPLS